MKIKSISLYFLIVFASLNTKAQDWEYGGIGGIMGYKGDLAPRHAIHGLNPMGGLFIKANVSPIISFGIMSQVGRISGDANNYDYLAAKNLNFSSPIVDGTLFMEYNFFRFTKGLRPKQFTPFLQTGIGATYFNPSARYNDESFNLHEIGTEGQNIPNIDANEYSRIAIHFPINAGFKYQFARNWVIAVFGGYKLTTTDYLDDIGGEYVAPERFNSEQTAFLNNPANQEYSSLKITGKERSFYENFDWYYFLGLRLSYVIPVARCFEF